MKLRQGVIGNEESLSTGAVCQGGVDEAPPGEVVKGLGSWEPKESSSKIWKLQNEKQNQIWKLSRIIIGE